MTSTARFEAAFPETTTVAIVGAGPSGLTLAITLAEAGIDFVLLDKLAEGANTSRAGVVHARTLEVLEQLGTAEQLIDTGLRLNRFAVRDGARPLVQLSFAGLPTKYPFALLTPQSTTERVLRERLEALGGTVHRPYQVADLAQDADGVVLTMSTGERLRAAYAVGADGMHSTVREAAGIGFTGGSYDESFVLADVRMDWAPGAEEVSLTLGGDGVFVVAPLPGDGYRVVAVVDQARAQAAPDLETVRRLVEERAPGQAVVHEVRWSSRFRVHHRVADRYRAGRVFVIGDAAHVHSPVGGQGMNTGMQDGYALGRAFATGDLDGYEVRRRPVAQRVVAFTDRMTRIATATGAGRHLRNAVLPVLGRTPAFRRRMAYEIAELSYR
ncbi:FAD-binding protein [Kitasatospora acidiphila]|uniref:FAD-binding protein n=1 Tax=Kitasatospora acidiphila TaxID=2567942 RepID=A0A540WCD2_9ACTN|nr:FAD-dependent monooxygenase [Kitasatospora acidiphila]TQF06673.1 FAD-binding protein [Kitasatospora acidiphila]